MFRVLILLAIAFNAEAAVCSELYNNKGVAIHYNVLGQSYTLKGYQRTPIFSSNLDYHYRLLGGSLQVSRSGVTSDYSGHFSYSVIETSAHHKSHCETTYLISVTH